MSNFYSRAFSASKDRFASDTSMAPYPPHHRL